MQTKEYLIGQVLSGLSSIYDHHAGSFVESTHPDRAAEIAISIAESTVEMLEDKNRRSIVVNKNEYESIIRQLEDSKEESKYLREKLNWAIELVTEISESNDSVGIKTFLDQFDGVGI